MRIFVFSVCNTYESSYVGFSEILVSCVYFEIVLVVYEMTDPLLGAPS